MGTERLRLSRAQCSLLDALCRAPATRSRLGRGLPSPTSQRERSRWERTWRFPDAAAAGRWNAAWEAALASEGAVHPALVSLGGEPIPDPLQAAVARIGAAVLMEEVEAGGLPPTAYVGGRFVLGVEHVYQTSPHAWAHSSLVLALDGRVLDAAGELVWTCEASREYPLESLSGDVAPHLVAQQWPPLEEVFG